MIITRRVEFDAGHRVCRHGGKCKGLHGHRYVVEASVGGPVQDKGPETEMVMDFSRLKALLQDIIVNPLDHTLMLWEGDPLILSLPNLGKPDGSPHWTRLEGELGTLVLLPLHPTAEGLAAMFAARLVPQMAGHSSLVRVRVWETPNCFADWTS